jgi:hypothetical protein
MTGILLVDIILIGTIAWFAVGAFVVITQIFM